MSFSIVRPTTRLCLAMLLLLQGSAVADAWGFFSSFPCIFGIFCSNDEDTSPPPPPPSPPSQPVITVPPPQLGGNNNNNNAAPETCNGIPGLCDLRASDIMFGMVHNAMATREDNFRFYPNHNSQLEDAIAAGFRGISLDVCQCGLSNQLSFCHGSCVLGTRSMEDVMGHISDFLDKNPNEVILINLQLDGRASRVVDIQELYDEFNDVAPGLMDKLYVHPNPGLAWPTLGSLVQSGKQVLLFHHNGPNCDTTTCPPGFHEWFKYSAETEFSFSNVDDILDTASSCQITRGGSSTKQFFQVNSFVTLPSQDASEVLNTVEFAEDRIDDCSNQNGGLDVNVLSVDFWKSGDIPQVVAQHNKALVDRRRRMLLLEEEEEDFDNMMMEEYNAL